VIGYYIHHHGRGHLHRALAIATASGAAVTGLSSLPRPDEWDGPWVQLPMDDGDAAADVEANGRLHWVPLGSAGLASRMAAIAEWIEKSRPDTVVVDVSVEVALQVRLLGVPVVVVALPGVRADAPHALGYDVASAILAAWPPEAEGTIEGLSATASARLHPVGAISRLRPLDTTSPRDRHVLVLAGGGGDDLTPEAVNAATAATPGWTWRHVGGSSGAWVDDPLPLLAGASVVITHAGQSALADVAAARRPAVVLPQERPFREQATTARVLAGSDWPAVVCDTLPDPSEWNGLLTRAAALDGSRWSSWNDGQGARRAAEIIQQVADGRIR
jgi:predicted glycosyltransferase